MLSRERRISGALEALAEGLALVAGAVTEVDLHRPAPPAPVRPARTVRSADLIPAAPTDDARAA